MTVIEMIRQLEMLVDATKRDTEVYFSVDAYVGAPVGYIEKQTSQPDNVEVIVLGA